MVKAAGYIHVVCPPIRSGEGNGVGDEKETRKTWLGYNLGGGRVAPAPRRRAMADNGRQKGDEALALASGQTLRAAAASAHVSERTAARRWADATFRRRVSELRAEMVSRALGRMADG